MVKFTAKLKTRSFTNIGNEGAEWERGRKKYAIFSQ